MDEEDRKVAMDQLTSYDRFASLNRAFAVVAVPQCCKKSHQPKHSAA